MTLVILFASLTVAISAGLMLLMVYHMIIPEYGIHFLVCILLLASGSYLSSAFSSLLVLYHIWRYMKRPATIHVGLFDPTTILNKRMLLQVQRETVAKLAFYFVLFMVCLYNLLLVALADEDNNPLPVAPGQVPVEPL